MTQIHPPSPAVEHRDIVEDGALPSTAALAALGELALHERAAAFARLHAQLERVLAAIDTA